MAKGIRLQILIDGMEIVNADSLTLNLISRWGYGGKMNLLGDLIPSAEAKLQINITPVETMDGDYESQEECPEEESHSG